MPPTPSPDRTHLGTGTEFLRAVLTLGLDRILDRGFEAARDLPSRPAAFSGVSALVGVGLLYAYAFVIAFLYLVFFLRTGQLPTLEALWPGFVIGSVLIAYCVALGIGYEVFQYFVWGRVPPGQVCHVLRQQAQENVRNALTKVAIKEALLATVHAKMTSAQLQRVVGVVEQHLQDCRTHLDSAAGTINVIGT